MLKQFQYKLTLLKYITPLKIWNFLLLTVSFYINRLVKKQVIWGLPCFYSIEPTNACNLACSECPTGNKTSKREKKSIDVSRYIYVIKIIKKYCLHLNLFFQGEPFLHESIIELIKIGHKANIFTCISTNGHFLSEENAVNVINSGLDKIIISLDGIDYQSYKKYRINGNFDLVVDGIKTLSENKKKFKRSHPIIEVQCLILSSTENKMPEFKQFAQNLGADIVTFKTAQFYDLKNRTGLMPKSKPARYIKNETGEFVINRKLKPYCYRLWTNPVITASGDFLPCCFDKYSTFVQGNIFSENIHQIWNSKSYKNFRKKVMMNRESIDICRNCTSK